MPVNRPKLARVHTPRSETERKAHLAQGISLTFNGETYTVRLGDLTAVHARLLRQATGRSFMGLINELRDECDLDSIAGLIWLARTIRGDDITYEDQLAAIGYDIDIDIKDAAPAVAEVNDPEA